MELVFQEFLLKLHCQNWIRYVKLPRTERSPNPARQNLIPVSSNMSRFPLPS